MPSKNYYQSHLEALDGYRRAYYAAHREELLARVRQRRQANLTSYRARERAYEVVHREKRLAKKRAWAIRQRELGISWRHRHREQDREQRHRHYEAHTERILQQTREYRSRNKERVREWSREATYRRRVQTSGGAKAGRLTQSEWELLKAAYDNRCAYCGLKKPLTRDHIFPLRLGGGHSAMNIVPACLECNQRKRTSLWGHLDPPNGCPFHPWVQTRQIA